MKIIKSIRHAVWTVRTETRKNNNAFAYFIARKSKVLKRKFSSAHVDPSKEIYTFAILCIKKTEYVELVIRQANSLHYFNPVHKFVVYADDMCADALEKSLGKLDYPKQISVKRAFGVATLPWQIYKMDMRIENARLGGIDIDADMVWHDDPIIDRTRPLMFAPAFIFKDNPVQADIVLKLFKKPEWLNYTHFVSAFVSIPAKFMTEKVAEDARNFMKTMLEDPLTFLELESDRIEIRRTSEEIGICFALQSNYPGLTRPLKDNGDKKNRNLLEPIYYGCEFRVIA